MPRRSWSAAAQGLAGGAAAPTPATGFTQRDGVRIEIAWKPNPGPQEAAIACPIPELFYGGARGGGKTDFLLADFAVQAQQWGSRAQGLFLRRTYKELDEAIRRSKQVYGRLGARFYESTDALMWVFPPTEWDVAQGFTEGAVLKFRHLRKVADAEEYQGHSYTWIGVDEAGQFPDPEPIDLLRATMRSPWEHLGLVPLLRLTGNPGGPGHVWLKERYIKPAPFGYVPIRYQPQPTLMPDVWAVKVFIPSKVSDNPTLDQRQYRVRLAQTAQGNEQLLKAWLLGDWDVFVGQAFHEWSQEAHVIPNGIQHLLDGNWRWVAGLDWGARKGCYVLAAVGPEGQIEVVLTLPFGKATRTGAMSTRQAAEWVARKTQLFPTPEWIFTGHDMRQTDVNRGGKSLEELWTRGMLDFYRTPERCPRLKIVEHSKGARAVKYSLMHEYLRWTDERDEEGRLQPWAVPRLRFQRRCEYLIETLPALPVDEEQPEDDVDTDADDHGYDACCNILLARTAVAADDERETPADRTPGFTVTKSGTRARGRRRKRARVPRLAELAMERQPEGYYSVGYGTAGLTGELAELED